MHHPKQCKPVAWFAVLALLGLGCGQSIEVKVIVPRRGEIQESFTEPARTRLAKTYRITAPVDCRIERIDLEHGDPVKQGQLLMKFDLVPFTQEVAEAQAAVEELVASLAVLDDNRLEDTALVETFAVVDAAGEAVKAADKQVEAQQARSDRAALELKRMQDLVEHEAIPQSRLDDARLEAETTLIDLRREEFVRAALHALLVAVQTGPQFVSQWVEHEQLKRAEIEHQLAQAHARLARARHRLSLTDVRSPIDGVVLERHDQGDRPMQAGEPVLLLGNLDQLEVIADVLTQDAMRLTPGAEVTLQPATRMQTIRGRVKRIEPQGFTKLSSLGVEQQRVNVIVSLEERPANIGVGYRLRARFLTASKPEALIVPRYSVLQAPDQSFYAFRVEGGRLSRTPVKLGLRSDLELEIVAGLGAGDQIVAAPEASMRDGGRVRIAR